MLTAIVVPLICYCPIVLLSLYNSDYITYFPCDILPTSSILHSTTPNLLLHQPPLHLTSPLQHSLKSHIFSFSFSFSYTTSTKSSSIAKSYRKSKWPHERLRLVRKRPRVLQHQPLRPRRQPMVVILARVSARLRSRHPLPLSPNRASSIPPNLSPSPPKGHEAVPKNCKAHNQSRFSTIVQLIRSACTSSAQATRACLASGLDARPMT